MLRFMMSITDVPIKPAISPLHLNAPINPLAFDVDSPSRSSSSSSTSSSGTFCEPQPTSGLLLIFPDKGKIATDEAIADGDAPPPPLPSPPAGCTKECGVCVFQNDQRTDHLLNADELPALSSGLPSAPHEYTSFSEIPLSPLNMSSLTSLSLSMTAMASPTETVSFSPVSSLQESSSWVPVDFHVAEGNFYADLVATNIIHNRIVFDLPAPQPKLLASGELPPFLQPPPPPADGMLGLTSQYKYPVVKRLERKVGGGTSSAHPTTAPHSPLRRGVEQLLPNSDGRLQGLGSPIRPSEFELLQPPVCRASLGSLSNTIDLADPRHAIDVPLGFAPRRAETDMHMNAYWPPASDDLGALHSFRDEPLPVAPPSVILRPVELPPTENDVTVLPLASEASLHSQSFAVDEFGWPVAKEAMSLGTQPSSMSVKQEETNSDVGNNLDSARLRLLSYLQECFNVSSIAQEHVALHRPLNYDSALLGHVLDDIFSEIRLELSLNAPVVTDLPNTERALRWFATYIPVISSLQRTALSFLRLAACPARAWSIDKILNRLSRYRAKFQDILTRLRRLHAVSEVLVLRARLEASYRTARDTVGAERHRRQVEAVERQRERMHRHELREHIRSKKRAARSRAGF